jgi:hypothetical protein
MKSGLALEMPIPVFVNGFFLAQKKRNEEFLHSAF